jgi:Fe-Mn family superoxide dismutase
MYKLPELPFAKNALEPFISEKTIEFHYGKHHQAYIDNLNKLVVGTEFENKPLEDIILQAKDGIFNNAAQVWNHSFFWNCLTPNGSAIKDNLLSAINQQFNSLDDFKNQFTAAALSLFGSGWVWLAKDSKGKLEIIKESNAGNPLRNGFVPIMTLDVWEHAYYLDYQNKRAGFIDAFWNICDWEKISERY